MTLIKEDDPAVCNSTGAMMRSLVNKLIKLKKKHPMVGELLQDLDSLTVDHVNKFSGGRETDEQVRMWLKHVRELVYDIEDWADLLIQKNKDGRMDPKAARRNLQQESEAEGEQIQEFKAQIQDARDHYRCYDLLNKAVTPEAHHVYASPRDVPDDSGLLWEEKTVLIGADAQRSELENHLKDEQKRLKVVSVLGMEGIGKSTLAREIYEKLKWQFEFRAYVYAGENTSTRTLFDMFYSAITMGKTDPSNFIAAYREEQLLISRWGERHIITCIREFLSAKRYLIFIDDVQSPRTSRIINSALPDNNLGSRIITTSCIKEVAMSCSRRPIDVIYQMKPLSQEDSRSLFFITISGEEEERFAELNKGYDIMLKLCGGMPLAILVTAGLFVGKSTQFGPPKMIDRTVLSNIVQYYFTQHGLRTILEISYGDLPLPIKACFLYLSVFPKNYTINKNHLIRRWAAEGFIAKTEEKDFWETGDIYFKELVSRRLIQPVFDYSDDETVGCTVHGVIHDFIASLSSKDNFVTVGAELSSGLFPRDTIRRFSVNCSNQEEAETMDSSTMHLSRIRTLTVFWGAAEVPDFSSFRFLRVLDLQDIVDLGYDQLKSIGSLSLLRYLGICGTDRIIELPRQITALESLTTLDSKQTSVALNAFRSRKLVSLLADGVVIWRGMKKMKELEELSTITVDCRDSLYALAEIVNKWKKLRVLGAKFFDTIDVYSETNRLAVIRFLKEVGKSNLHSLTFDDYPVFFLDLLIDCWSYTWPHHLHKFELRLYDPCLVEVPKEMGFLLYLTHLHITVATVEAEGLNAFGMMPNLVLLYIYSNYGNRKRCTISKKVGFERLKVFYLTCYGDGEMCLQFEPESMPQLRRLWLHFNPSLTKYRFDDFSFGIQNLSCLVEVRATIFCWEAKVSDAMAAEAAIMEQVSQNSNNPLLAFSRLGEDDMIRSRLDWRKVTGILEEVIPE